MQPWKLINDAAQLKTALNPEEGGEGGGGGGGGFGPQISADGQVVADSGFASFTHPKLKFNFTVDLSFRGSVVGASKMALLDIPVKTASRPTQTLALTDVNYYNYRTKVTTRVEVGQGTIVMYDDADGKAHDVYTKYMNLINPVSNIRDNRTLIDNPSSVPFGEMSSLRQLPGNPNGIFDTISVYHFYTRRGRVYRMEYRYINPKVETFELDELSMSESEVNTITLTFAYDGVTTLETEVTE